MEQCVPVGLLPVAGGTLSASSEQLSEGQAGADSSLSVFWVEYVLLANTVLSCGIVC